MKIIVCMKQVPATQQVEIDPDTGNLRRGSAGTRTNPYDLAALEMALRLREQMGGTVTVLSMGPKSAETMARDAYLMGADDAVILSDGKFAGSDVLATSYALSQGVKLLGSADLILCGRQTTDGDTAQVGPALAEHLHIPHAAWVAAVESVDEKGVTIRQDFGTVTQRSMLSFPCLLTVEQNSCVPRLPSYRRKAIAANKEVRFVGFNDLPSPDLSRCGSVGSPTFVERIFAPPAKDSQRYINGSADEQADELYNLLVRKKFV